MIPIVSIVGNSNSGKTTLIERIISELKAKGYRVGAIKHDAHNFDIDHEGKDSWRMSASGAETVVISSHNKIAMVKNIEHEKSIDELADWMFFDEDIVITEGYKAHDKPKIEVVRFNKLISSPQNNLIAIVDNTPEGMTFSLPEDYSKIVKFDMKDIKSIIFFIESRFILKNL